MFLSVLICVLFNYLVKYTLHKKVSQQFLKPAVWNYPTTKKNSDILILLSKLCPFIWHLVSGNRVRNGRDSGPKYAKLFCLKLHFSKIPMDSVQWNTKHYGMHDDIAFFRYCKNRPSKLYSFVHVPIQRGFFNEWICAYWLLFAW